MHSLWLDEFVRNQEIKIQKISGMKGSKSGVTNILPLMRIKKFLEWIKQGNTGKLLNSLTLTAFTHLRPLHEVQCVDLDSKIPESVKIFLSCGSKHIDKERLR